jgi:2-hydroxychromene-2-carboxylate isomerase
LQQPVFSFDIGSPEAYLAAERVAQVLGVVPEWEPVLASALRAGDTEAFRCAEERDVYMTELERRAAARGLQLVRWPPWPFDSEPAMLAAVYARGIGKIVAFSLAAFRQAYAAGLDLSKPEGVIVAGAACEIHPRALLRALESRAVADALEESTARAAAAGITSVPAVRVGGAAFHGDDGLEAAAKELVAA